MTYNEKPSLPPGGEWLLELARKLWGKGDDGETEDSAAAP